MLLKGVQIGSLYKLLGRTISDEGNSSIVHEIGAKEGITPIVSRENTMSWEQILGHIREMGLCVLHNKGMVKVMSILSLDLIYVNISYMGSIIL
jgi:hypothetical protein